MSDFAIRCPHCGNWDKHDEDPSSVVVNSSHVDTVMEDFQKAIQVGNADTFPCEEKKMFRCKSPRWACPASFEAFIFDNEQKAHESLKNIKKKWAISRDFRLYKANKQDRWDKPGEKQYFCIMFGTEPVPRQRDIELEHLLDPMLIQKIIKSINHELKIPLTIYSGNVLARRQGKELCWMPIEAYSGDASLVPSAYNSLCNICRSIVNKKVQEEFQAMFNKEQICPNNCLKIVYKEQIPNRCERKAACMQKPMDLNHCPLFIQKRNEWCFCYKSDMGTIDLMIENIRNVKNIWNRNELTVENRCPAGFTEIALPIIVHEHLVGVAMSGQVFFNMDQVRNVEKFFEQVRAHSTQSPYILEYSKTKLEIERCVLLKQEKCLESGDVNDNKAEEEERRFFLTRPEWDKRVSTLDESVQSLEKVAEARYRDIRSRSENAFRDELMGYTQNVVMEQMGDKNISFFQGDRAPIVHIMQRMRIFWAFDATAYIWWDHKSRMVNLVSYSAELKNQTTGNNIEDRSKTYGFPGNPIQSVNYDEFQEHPIVWLWDPKHRPNQKPHANKLLNNIFFLIKDSQEIANLNLPRNECYLIVIVPFGENVYGFVFLARDEKNVSRTPPKKSLAVSELCQEFVLRTCTEMVYELCDVKYREQQRGLKWNLQELHPEGQQSQSIDSMKMTGMTGMENT